MSNKRRVTVFIVNDFLSKIVPFRPFIPGEGAGEELGGLARIGNTIQEAMTTSPGQVLAFIAGLDFCGPVTELYEGEAEMAGLKAAGFSGAVPGIHEFEYGPDQSGHMLRKATFPIISSNLIPIHESINNIFISHAVYDTRFAKVGVFGLSMVALTSVMEQGATLECGPYVDCAQSAVTALQRKGCDIIVGVTHIGLEMDKKVAAEVAGIHAILGAHSHSLTRAPVEIKGPGGEITLVMQAGTGGALLGQLDLVIEEGQVDKQCSKWNLLPMNSDIPQLQSVVDTVCPFVRGVEAHLSSNITRIENDLDGRFATMRKGASTLGNLIADSFSWCAKADIGLVSAGLIQGNTIILAGEISYGQVSKVLPFSNSVFIYRVTGQELLEILRISAKALITPEPTPPGHTLLSPRSFLQVSGLQLKYSSAGTLLSAKIEKEGSISSVDSSANYTIAGPSWFCHGGDGYNLLSRVTCWNTGFHDAEALVKYLRSGYVEDSESIQRIFIRD